MKLSNSSLRNLDFELHGYGCLRAKFPSEEMISLRQARQTFGCFLRFDKRKSRILLSLMEKRKLVKVKNGKVYLLKGENYGQS